MTDQELNRLRAIIINADASLDEYKILMATIMDANTAEAMHLERLKETDTSTCYQCENETDYLFPDGRCNKCTRLTKEEIEGQPEDNTQ